MTKYLLAAREIMKTCAWALLCAILLGCCVAIWRLPAALDSQANAARAALVAELVSTRQDLTAEITSARGDVSAQMAAAIAVIDRQASGVRRDAIGQVVALRGDMTGKVLQTLDGRLVAIQQDAVGQMSEMNRSVSVLVSGVNDALKPIGDTAQQINQAAPLWLDCEFNPSCAFNRYAGTSKAIEQAAQAVAKEAPHMAATAGKTADALQGIASSLDEWIERLTAPQTVKQQLKEWLKVFIMAASRVI